MFIHRSLLLLVRDHNTSQLLKLFASGWVKLRVWPDRMVQLLGFSVVPGRLHSMYLFSGVLCQVVEWAPPLFFLWVPWYTA